MLSTWVEDRLAKTLLKWATNTIFSSDYTSIAEVISKVGSTQTTFILHSSIPASNISGIVTIPSNISVRPENPGVISKGSATSLTINGPIVGGAMHQWLSGFAVGEIKIAQAIDAVWFAESGNGLENTPYVVDFTVVDGAAQLQEYGAVYIHGGSWYKIKTAPWIMQYTDTLYSVGGRGWIKNETAGQNALEQSYGRDYFSISDIGIKGQAGTGKGLYIYGAGANVISRWHLNNVVSVNHGSHGVHIEGNTWIGNIVGGVYSNNTGDGIRIDAISDGSPNGVDMYSPVTEGNGGYGIRVGAAAYIISGTINVVGGVIETNTSGGVKVDYVNSFSMTKTHLESDDVYIGGNGVVRIAKLANIWGNGEIVVGSSCSIFDYDGGHCYNGARHVYTNTRGSVKIKNVYAQVDSPGEVYFEERGPNAPTYISSFNMGKKGTGNLLKNGAFQKRTANNVVPRNWTETSITSHTSSANGSDTNFFGRIHQIVADSGGKIEQTFNFNRLPDYPLYASIWMKVAGGTGAFAVTIGTRTWELSITNASYSNWARYTLPCLLDPSDNTQGTIILSSQETGSTILFAEAQVVTDMDIVGWRCNDTGIIDSLPITDSFVATNADTSGATLGQLETEVNEMKLLLRNHGLLLS